MYYVLEDSQLTAYTHGNEILWQRPLPLFSAVARVMGSQLCSELEPNPVSGGSTEPRAGPSP